MMGGGGGGRDQTVQYDELGVPVFSGRYIRIKKKLVWNNTINKIILNANNKAQIQNPLLTELILL